MKRMRMLYDLATNFDDELIRRVAPYGVVKSLYGKLQKDIVGGGRPSFAIGPVSEKQLERHIDVAHEHGMKFSYLFNALCSDNREFAGRTNGQMRDFVKHLQNIGVDIITIGSPFMLQLVKDVAPEMGTCVSVYNDVDSTERIRAWEQMGADELTLHYGFNRSFKKLAQALKATDLNLRIIANNTCLHDCIYRTNHANALAHSSQSKHESDGFFLDFYSLNCGMEKFESPGKFIAADWIRPEDVHHYEELCESLGKTNLTFKLTERSRPTDWLVRVVKAYAEQSYDGNLFDILNYRTAEFANVQKSTFVRGALMGKARVGKMREMQKAVFPTPVYVDNKSLEGFMEPFLRGHDCSAEVCGVDGWGVEDPKDTKGSCSYCRTIAEQYLRFNGGESARQEAIDNARRSVSDLVSGEMFR